jgi:simple sugar transport system ATP-binding protein
MSLIFVSSELEEVIRCSDRIVVMRDRKKIAEVTGDDINEEGILKIIAQEAC